MRAKKSAYAWTAMLLLMVSLAAGCNRAATPNDAQIAGDVQSRLQSQPNLAGNDITVNSNRGVVTLSGSVASEMERTTAANEAAQVEGVRTVVNNLQVGQAQADMGTQPEATAPAKAAPVRRKPQPVADSRWTPPQQQQPAAAAPVQAAAARPAPAPAPVTVPSGTQLVVRISDLISSEEVQNGDTFTASLDQPVYLDDDIVIPRGADLQGRVVDVKSAGKFKGQSQLVLALTGLSVNGRSYRISTNTWSREGSSRGKNTAAKVGGGAAVGALIGGLAGGGKGAAIGAAVGAGAGTGVQAATKGEQIELRPETLLTFQLEESVSVIPSATRQR